MPPEPPFRHAIEVAGLRKVYTTTRGTFRRTRVENVALDGINLAIAPGELFGLLGPNGAGKTTTVKILTTLLLPTSGRARVLGHDVVTATNDVRRRIGFVFGGERGLYWRLSGYDNLRYFADLYRIPPQTSKRRIAELLDVLGLAGREHDKVEGYSRGMKQRLHLARGLLNDPDVLFLDEPTIGLDPVGARDLRVLIRGLADSGKTVFLTTHYMFEADAICDRVAVIKKGAIVAEGTPRSIKQLVGEIGVVEFEVDAISPRDMERLQGLAGVSSVVAAERDLAWVVTIQCAQTSDVMTQLGKVLDGVAFRRVSSREATLEDAYVALIGEQS